ncbi:hypothetical protein [Streptomyces sp. NBC_01445]|uniref:hypothetical protein n=1 Tax=Streptomyces sp. NBC_01445 TaxID=2903869 RepID=UPI002DD8F72E|nr:hypothetical protein [Streptomyces sp. NBC_01445]WSE02077.1 hypothetical protein OG574_00710 [Streptomyces sp. NBC_01445]WSE10253.1 hypothetical protein OG574_47300 [Streptomyces sp. NBC_01445]WSE11178.1 hypothetical protein OG574_48720 [Streptomyces sp. NBC_01445]
MHAVAPLHGIGLHGAVWDLAHQLGAAARTPGELIAALAADQRPTTIVLPDLDHSADPESLSELALALANLQHVRLLVEVTHDSPPAARLSTRAPAVMDLDHDQWTDAARLAAWQAANPAVPAQHPQTPDFAIDLDDPAQVVGADPMTVTTRYETSPTDHAGLRTAWLRAGQSLTNEPHPATRALILQTALGDNADPRLADHLAELAEDAPWRLVWSRASGDVRPPWPGPVRALATGRDALDGTVLMADHRGIVRAVSAADAAPQGRLPRPFPATRTLAVLPGGMALTLNSQGHLDTQHSPAAPKPTGIQALLDDGTSPTEQLLDTVRAHLARQPGQVLAASGTLLATADRAGCVHAHLLDQPSARPQVATLHPTPVTALAVMDVKSSDDTDPLPLVYSGGADGHVRVWSPGHDPLSTPVATREVAVSALAAAQVEGEPTLAIAWTDGLVEHHSLSSGTVRPLRLGSAVHALALTAVGSLIVGTDEMVGCLRPC